MRFENVIYDCNIELYVLSDVIREFKTILLLPPLLDI